MLTHYHRWVYENHKTESFEASQEYETDFRSGRWKGGFKNEGKKLSYTFLADLVQQSS